jgi:hypothetical protein
MLDMIRNSQVPSYMMLAAVRGALSVPPEETIEILVHLALHNKIFGEQARLTLAGWDEGATKKVAADPETSTEVLSYFVSPKNMRPALLPLLLENPSVRNEQIIELAQSGSRETVEVLLASPRVNNSPTVLEALRTNVSLRPNEVSEIEKRFAIARSAPGEEAPPAAMQLVEETNPPETAGAPEAATGAGEQVLMEALERYLKENEQELAREKEKPFELVRPLMDETAEHRTEGQVAAPAAPAAANQPAAPLAKARRPAHEKEEKRDSTLQKIARLDVKGRIALAVRGSKEDRSILIRDGTKLVALAVLDSPKVTDGEVEGFASQKNVLEAVLRGIPLKRRFAKNYVITRNLVFNPRTPIDLSLALMKNMLVHDLKNLSANKEVSDTIRKLALRMFKQKVEKKG